MSDGSAFSTKRLYGAVRVFLMGSIVCPCVREAEKVKEAPRLMGMSFWLPKNAVEL